MTAIARASDAVRHDEARRVVAAYAVQVETRRKRWLAAATPAECRAAAADLSEAMTQHAWAKEREREAWRAWHGTSRG